MAEVCAFFPIVRTRGNLTFYMMDGKNYVRKKSSLTAKRVKTSRQFARTRYYAGLMGEASKIGSVLFQALPVRWRQSWMYRTFTGEAMRLLKAGKTVEEAKEVLWGLYVKEVVDKVAGNTIAATTFSYERCRRQYLKRNHFYWSDKSTKAIKRKQKKEVLQYHAHLMARASMIASGLYRNLPAHQRQYPLYKAMTRLAMVMLKEELNECKVREAILIAQGPKSYGIIMTKKAKNKLNLAPIFSLLYIPGYHQMKHGFIVTKHKALPRSPSPV